MNIVKRELPMIRWAPCPLCQGTGKVITGSEASPIIGTDASGGAILPCPSVNCDNGTVKAVFVREDTSIAVEPTRKLLLLTRVLLL